MAAMPFLLFPAVLLLAAALAVANRNERRRLAIANLALAIVAALLIVNEAIAYALRSSIRIDLLFTLPALSVAALSLGLLGITRTRGSTRPLAGALAVCGGGALGVYAFFFVRTSLDAAEQSRQHFTGNRMYWEETIRCQGAIIERFGTLDRNGDPCTGNLRVTASTGGYPFTRVVVNDRRHIYLMFSPEAGVETVYGIEDTWPFHGTDTPVGMTAQGTATSGKLSIDLRRHSETCEAAIVQENNAKTVLQLKREQLGACAAPLLTPVQLAGSWSTMEALGTQHAHLVQLWLWTSDKAAWAMLVDSVGVRGQERRFNFARRFEGKAVGSNSYQLHPSSKLDGTGVLTVALRNNAAHIDLSEPRRVLMLDMPAQLTHPKIRLAPLYDTERFAAYFGSVLRLVDMPWTPASSP